MVFMDVNSFLSPQGGGARTYHLQKAEWFSRQPEHSYLVLGPGSGTGYQVLGSSGFRMHTGWGIPYGHSVNYRFLTNFSEADRLLEKESVDVLEIGDPWLSARWSRHHPGPIRTSMWHSDPHTAYLGPWAAKGMAWRRLATGVVAHLVDSWHRHYDRIWCASDWVAQLLVQRGYPNVERIRFGIDKTVFRPLPPDRDLLGRFGLDPERPILIYSGRLDFEKGVDVLFDSVPKLLSIPERPQVLIAGRGEWEERFRALSLPGFAYAGFLERDELSRLLPSSTLMVATCPVETFGLGVLESLCAGVPVVSPDGGGGGEQVRTSGAGELFRPGDSDDLVRAVQRALPRRSEFSDKALSWAQAWPSWDDMFRAQTESCLELARGRA